MNSSRSTFAAALLAIVHLCDSSGAQGQDRRTFNTSANAPKVTGPAEAIDHAVAAGATATITLQPVAPKTVPATSYPPGTTIVGSTIHLSSVPARVWFETHVTGWAPEMLRVGQVRIDAMDLDLDGGGYDGDRAECNGTPALGAGDLYPATVPCASGVCEDHPAINCLSNNDCPDGGDGERCRTRSCTGNPAIFCFTDSDCTDAGTTGPCRTFIHDPCRAAISGMTGPCGLGEPSRCAARAPFYEPGGYVCDYAFYNKCDPRDVLNGASGISVVDNSTVNLRFGFAVDPGEVVTDFNPTLLAIFVLDVPADARGTYQLDYDLNETFLLNFEEFPDNFVPVTALNMGVIEVPCGRCCSGYNSGQVTCENNVGVNDCPNSSDQLFTDGMLCPPDGPNCLECLQDSHCDDEILCTVDNCLSNGTCQNAPDHGLCDDGQFCNGEELCSGSFGCTPGTPPCDPGLVCDEQADVCTNPAGEIPTVSTWGLLILALGLLAAAKVQSQRSSGWGISNS